MITNDHAAGFQRIVHPMSAANMIMNEVMKSFFIDRLFNIKITVKVKH